MEPSTFQPILHSQFSIFHSLRPITSTNTARTLTAEDFERGFMMTCISTDGRFSFRYDLRSFDHEKQILFCMRRSAAEVI